jgi:hypothetical protein
MKRYYKCPMCDYIYSRIEGYFVPPAYCWKHDIFMEKVPLTDIRKLKLEKLYLNDSETNK